MGYVPPDTPPTSQCPAVTSRIEAQDMLRRIGSLPDEEVDLAEAGLALAILEGPEGPLDRYRDHLARLAAEVAALVPAESDTLDARVTALRTVLVQRHGYTGDIQTYDDFRNANLLQVIERRRGLPVALGILFLHTARAQGWTMVGLNFPGHFLVRLEHAGERTILDPFNQGQTRTAVELRDLLKVAAGADAELTPEYYAPVGNRDILLRLQNNLKLRFLKADRVDKAVEILEGMLLFAPDEAGLWRETGLLHAHLGNLGAAVGDLEQFMERSTNDLLRHQTALLLQQLKNRLN
jgi:regulator of sirC expression with transglutaminase-like and TPR domain